MQYFAKLRIAGKLTVIVMGIVLLFAILSGALMLVTLSDIMRASLERRGLSVAAEVAELSSDALQTGNLFALEELIHTEKRNNDFVSYIFLLDTDGRVMAHTFPKGMPLHLRELHGAGGAEPEVLRVDTSLGQIQDIRWPIEGGALGAVRVGVSEDALRELLVSNLLKMLMITLGILLLAAALISIVLAFITFFLLRDTPQSCGLPPIEEYKHDYPKEHGAVMEKQMTAKEVLMKYIIKNKLLWYLAIANIFVYFIRYGVVDWAPTYLAAVKGFSKESSRWAYFLYEWAGIPGMLVSGYLSDRVFRGRRAPATMIFMTLVIIAILVYWFNPPGNVLVDNLALIAIGFLIYGPVMMIGLQAADMVPRVATGGATGLTGLMGYIVGSAFAGVYMGFVVDHFGWTGGFISLLASCVLSIFFLFMSMGGKKAAE